MTRSITLILIVGLLSASVGTAAASAGERPQQGDQRVVIYSDLDVTQRDGSEALYQRIETAARDVCRMGPSRPLVLRAQARRCVEEAVADAVAEVGVAAPSAGH